MKKLITVRPRLGARLMFSMLLGGQLVLLTTMDAKASAGGANNCSSAQLPSDRVMQSQVMDSLPSGSVIPGSESNQTITIDCTSEWDDENPTCAYVPNWTIGETGIEQASLSGVYTVAGLPSNLGFQFIDASGQPLPQVPSNGTLDTGVVVRTGGQQVPIFFRLIKLDDSPVTSGTAVVRLPISCTGNEWANGAANGDARKNSTLTFEVVIERVVPTCEMVTPRAEVTLPTVSHSTFDGVGSTAGNTPFVLDFRCEADAAGRLNISDATTLTNDSEVLTMEPSSTASGVGVRLSHQGVPVKLAPNQAFDQSGSEFPLESPGDEQVISLPLSAEYIQTESNVTSGTVQALAIVTVAYD